MNCTCMDRAHAHPFRDCAGKPTYMGGICNECRYFAQGEPPAPTPESRGWAHTCYCLDEHNDESHRRYK